MFVVRILVLMALCVSAGTAADQTKRALAEEMLTLTHPEKTIDQVMQQMSGVVQQQLQAMNVSEDMKPAIDRMMQDQMSYLREKLDWAKLKPGYVDIYAEVFTEEELRQLVAFYKSPSGEAFVNKMPQVLQRSTAMVQGLLADLPAHLQEMNEKMRKQIEEERKQDKPKDQ